MKAVWLRHVPNSTMNIAYLSLLLLVVAGEPALKVRRFRQLPSLRVEIERVGSVKLLGCHSLPIYTCTGVSYNRMKHTQHTVCS